MDNITHTIIGLAIGQVLTRVRAHKNPKAAAKLRTPLLLTSALANNLPDLDIVYAGSLSGKLGYMLHHRGWTHTLLLAPLLSLVLLGLAWFWNSRPQRVGWSRSDWRWLWLVALLGPFTHIGFDFLNSYGVHPLWPFDSRWFYGDSLFIVEPMVWIVLLPLLLVESVARIEGIFYGALLALALGACFFTGYVPWQLTLATTLAAFWLWGLMWKLNSGARTIATVSAGCFLIGAFGLIGVGVRSSVREQLAKQFPGTEVLDIVLSPFPANPLCWSVLTVERTGTSYVSRQGVYAAAAHFIGAAECPLLRSESEHAFELKPVPAPPSPELLWSGQFEAKTNELKELASQSCTIRAMLRFIRVPAWRTLPDGGLLFGDLRFDRGGKRGFSKFNVELQPKECPGQLPGWEPPRHELLSAAEGADHL